MMIIKPFILSNLYQTDVAINKASLNISTGKRVNSAIDDPVAFNRITAEKASISAIGIKLNTLDFGMGRLDARDQVLGSMQETATRFQELATQAMSGTNKLTDLLPEMKALRQTMISLGNTQDVNGYMFSGTSGVTPFGADPVTGATTYYGNTTTNVINVDGVTMDGTMDGTPLMTTFAAMDAVLTQITGGTPPTAAQLTSVQGAVNSVLDLRTSGAAQVSGANTLKGALQGSSDRQTQEVADLESADLTTETVNLTQGQQQYQAILKMTGTILNQRRLMDYM